jgi:hypothetical protein
VNFAGKVALQYPANDVGLLFSHFTESMLDNQPADPQWGYFGFKFKKIIGESELAYVTKSNIAPLDSIQVFQLGYLKKLFRETQNKGRVIRLEDTEFCSSPDHKLIQICSKIELCRHYDGYTSLMKYVPPLFIPPGFFERQIKIRYGYEKRKDGWVNINPNAPWITEEVDLPILVNDIPHFWRERIMEVDVNPNFSEPIDRMQLTFYKNFNNPWYENSRTRNLVRSFYIYVILQGKSKVRKLLRGVAIAAGIFPYLKAIKNRNKS